MDFEEHISTFAPKGDVKIVVGASRVYQVRSTDLIAATQIGREELGDDDQEDGFFRSLFAHEPGVELSRKAVKKGVTTRYYIVVTDCQQDEQERYHLRLTSVQLDDDGQPLERLQPYLHLETGQRTLPVFEAFSAILGSIYNQPIDLGGPDESIRDRIRYAFHVIDLSEDLGVKYAIVRDVIHGLKLPPSEGPSLYNIIANGPDFWFEFASRIRSREIFREAVIHATGRFQMANMRRDAFDAAPEVPPIIEQKAMEIRERVKSLFKNILSYYPAELHRTAITGYADTDNIGRNSYGNDIFLWMALTMYRHAVSQEALTAVDGEDMGYDLVARIGKGGDAYFTMDDCRPFFTIFPMTAKARDVVEKKIKEIKDHVKPWAAGLLRNKSEIDVVTQPLGYFTCTHLTEEDYRFDDGEPDD